MSNPKKPLISLVIPVFNESGNIRPFYDSIMAMHKGQDWDLELIYVNDGSDDNSAKLIVKLPKSSAGIRLINFSRNFGKEPATTAGIKAARGDAIILIDADGQHPVELIPRFIERWKGGAEVVVGVRTISKSDALIKRLGSKVFYRMLNSLSSGNTVPGSTDFRLIDRKVANEFNKLTEHGRITRGLIDWLGFKREYIEFTPNERQSGKATYSLRKLTRLALHAFVSQSTKPLLLTGFLGTFVMVISFVLGLFMVTEKYILADPLSLGITGTAVLAVFLTFLVGLVLGCLGLLALYIESIHNETQNRPLYIIDPVAKNIESNR